MMRTFWTEKEKTKTTGNKRENFFSVYGALFLNCPNILCHVFRLFSYFRVWKHSELGTSLLVGSLPPKYRHLLPPLSKLQGVEFSLITIFSNGNKSPCRNANAHRQEVCFARDPYLRYYQPYHFVFTGFCCKKVKLSFHISFKKIKIQFTFLERDLLPFENTVTHVNLGWYFHPL